MAPVADAVTVSDAPTHTGDDPEAVTDAGTSLTVTEAVVATVLPHVLVAVSVYIPADNVVVVIADGF